MANIFVLERAKRNIAAYSNTTMQHIADIIIPERQIFNQMHRLNTTFFENCFTCILCMQEIPDQSERFDDRIHSCLRCFSYVQNNQQIQFGIQHINYVQWNGGFREQNPNYRNTLVFLLGRYSCFPDLTQVNFFLEYFRTLRVNFQEIFPNEQFEFVNVLGIGYAYGAIATKKRKFAAGANNMRQHEFLSFAQLVKDIITNSRNRNIHIYASHPSNIGITAVAWKDFLDLILKTDEGAYRIIANHTITIGFAGTFLQNEAVIQDRIFFQARNLLGFLEHPNIGRYEENVNLRKFLNCCTWEGRQREYHQYPHGRFHIRVGNIQIYPDFQFYNPVENMIFNIVEIFEMVNVFNQEMLNVEEVNRIVNNLNQVDNLAGNFIRVILVRLTRAIQVVQNHNVNLANRYEQIRQAVINLNIRLGGGAGMQVIPIE